MTNPVEKQIHIFDELAVILSRERLDGYLGHVHCNNSKNDALITYSWNIEILRATQGRMKDHQRQPSN